MLVQPDAIWGNLDPSQNPQKDTKCQNKRKKLDGRLAETEIEVIIQNVSFV